MKTLNTTPSWSSSPQYFPDSNMGTRKGTKTGPSSKSDQEEKDAAAKSLNINCRYQSHAAG